ncbi:hypothetical protein AB0M58_13615 [Streptomyces bobili]|uniref:hypothetical protein n=1 Tax=Streptomyces bobili TaxID=67280 RepID=UPI0034477B91
MWRLTPKQFEQLQARRNGGPRPSKSAARRATVQTARSRLTDQEPPPPDLTAEIKALAGAGRSWILLMPAAELLNSNQRRHWAEEARLRKRMRTEAALTARIVRVPPLQRAAVFYVLHPLPVERQRDPGNWADSAKPYVDGLVDADVLPDDNDRYLSGPFPALGEPVPGGDARISLVIVELHTRDNEGGNDEPGSGTCPPDAPT